MRKGQLENDQSQVSASAYSFEVGGQEIKKLFEMEFLPRDS